MTDQGNKGIRSVRVLTAVLLVATFGIGVLTGAGVYHWATMSSSPPPPPFLPLPLQELGLSEEQHRKIEEIVERHRPELDDILKETSPKVRAINDKIESEIREVLTLDQRGRLDEAKKRRPPHHHPPPPPMRPSGSDGSSLPPPMFPPPP